MIVSLCKVGSGHTRLGPGLARPSWEQEIALWKVDGPYYCAKSKAHEFPCSRAMTIAKCPLVIKQTTLAVLSPLSLESNVTHIMY